MHDVRDPLAQLVALARAEAERGPLDVGGHGVQSSLEGVGAPEHAGDRVAQAPRGVGTVTPADGRVDVPVGVLQVAREDLHPDEARRARQEDGAVGALAVVGGAVGDRSSSAGGPNMERAHSSLGETESLSTLAEVCANRALK